MCNLISLFFTSETAISETAISETAISGANTTKFRLCKENDKKMLGPFSVPASVLLAWFFAYFSTTLSFALARD